MQLDEPTASKFARIALGHVAREFPNKLDHTIESKRDIKGPRELHPVFFGSYDWHSCVHSWWMLLTLLRLFPTMPEAREIEALAETTFTAEKLAAELAYVEQPSARGFERPYGQAWLLALHGEAERHSEREWGERLSPLAYSLASKLQDYLSILTYPITTGTHFNTSFALILAREWAEKQDGALLRDIERYASQAYENKLNYEGWEPGGDEFLSPVLTASLLMSRVMDQPSFAAWFDGLALANGWLDQNCHPVEVSDRSDGKIAHLDGLNLSRAWCLRGIGKALGERAPAFIEERAKAHLEASMPHVSGEYMGEHWLASFAVLALLPPA